eukprot:TRINITY_DN50699_c0_g1_i1.p1 TRINITY_DN50699_c0_g1~~TRINITY_DN50699_c0_g1_i1.p1  ORF type:complete len:199 (+),score=40.92 TRINITY_DN50699_c0_g1_i1:65-598(+)
MPVRILDKQAVKEYFPENQKFAQVLAEKPQMDLYHLCSIGKSGPRLERCLQHKADVNKPNEMGASALMFACRSWSVPFVQRLLEAGADVNLEDRYGATALDYVNDDIKLYEEQLAVEKLNSRRRRLEMEVSGQILWDRPNPEDLEPFNELHKLHAVKKVIEAAGARPGENRIRPGYD